jgi:uncharacterized protein YlxP (DUF503 family)
VDPRASPAAAVLTVDLHLPLSTSLKDKRSVLKNLLEGARSRFGVAAAEVGDQDLRQRALLAFAAVAGSAGRVGEVLDSVERLVWSRPDVEVLDAGRSWMELP